LIRKMSTSMIDEKFLNTKIKHKSRNITRTFHFFFCPVLL
jgi:hypothetical protein